MGPQQRAHQIHGHQQLLAARQCCVVVEDWQHTRRCERRQARGLSMHGAVWQLYRAWPVQVWHRSSHASTAVSRRCINPVLVHSASHAATAVCQQCFISILVPSTLLTGAQSLCYPSAVEPYSMMLTGQLQKDDMYVCIARACTLCFMRCIGQRGTTTAHTVEAASVARMMCR